MRIIPLTVQGLSASIVPLTRLPSKDGLLRCRVPDSIPQGASTHEGSVPSSYLPTFLEEGCGKLIQAENRFFRSPKIVCGMKPHAYSDHDRD